MFTSAKSLFNLLLASAMFAGLSAPSFAMGPPPVCEDAYPSSSTLWPANHKFASVSIKGLGDSSIAIQCITQDEPLNTSGDGNTEFDGDGVGTSQALVRAERIGGGNGRVYHIDFLATNDFGQCYGQVNVGVPPSKKKAVTDDGELYVSVPNPNQCGGEPSNKPPVFTSSPLVQARVGVLYAYSLSATDPDGDALTFSLSQAPAGATLDAQSGEIHWSPTTEQLGEHAVEIVVSDDKGGSSVQTFVIVVLPPENLAPVIQSAPVTQGAVGRLYQYQVVATDADGDILQYSFFVAPGVQAPAGMTISSSGNIEWTPTLDQKGDYRIWVVVEDGNGGRAEQLYSLRIELVNNPPRITSIPAPQALIGQLYQYAVEANDPDGDSLSYGLNQAPAGMSIDAVSGLLSWTPIAGQVGEYSVEVLVQDGRTGSVSQAFTLHVVAPNHNPVINSEPTLSSSVGQPYIYNVEASDSDGDMLTYALSAAPEGASIDAQTGQLNWLPSSLQLGDNSFLIIVTDGQGGSASQSFNVLVIQPNRAPVITSTPILSVNENEAYLYAVNANDPDEGDVLTYRLTSAPQHMTIDSVTGVLQWLPTTADIGAHNVVVEVVDQQNLTGAQSFSLQVLDVNYPPVATNLTVTTLEDMPVEIHLQANDVDGDELQFLFENQPQSGVLTGVAPNLVYHPAKDFFGSDGFQYRVVDVAGEESFALVTINIEAQNDAPIILSSPQLSTMEGGSYQYQLVIEDADADSLTYLLTQAPSGMDVTAGGLIFWSPSYSNSGSYPVAISVTDGQAYATQSFVLSVVEENRAPVFLSAPIKEGKESEQYIYSVVVSDPDGDPVSLSLLGAPEGMSLAAGILNWVPDYNSAGIYPIVLAATDEFGGITEQSFSIVINNTNRLPIVPSEINVEGVEGEELLIQVNASDPDGDVLSYSLVNPPMGMTINSDGLISWALGYDDAGDYEVQVAVQDSSDLSVTSSVAVIIHDVNRPPLVTVPSLLSVYTNSLLKYELQAYDPDGDSIIFLKESGPDSFQIDRETGQISWLATQNDLGEHTALITIENGTVSVSVEIDVLVSVDPELSNLKSMEFWLPVISSAERNVLYLASEIPTSGTITLNATSQIIPFTIGSSGIWKYQLPQTYNGAGQGISNQSVHIYAETPVVASFQSFAKHNQDAFEVLPVHSLGKEHVISSYDQNTGSGFVFLSVLDGTKVNVTPNKKYTRDGINYEAGTSFTVTLNKGEFYRLYGSYYGTNLAGTRVISDKPIQVLNHHRCVNLPRNSSACDKLVSSAFAEEYWGTEYIVVPFDSRLSGDLVHISTGSDSARIFLNGVESRNIPAFGELELWVHEATEIKATSPVQVAHYSTGSTTDFEQIRYLPNANLRGDIFSNGLGEQSSFEVEIDSTTGLNYILIVKALDGNTVKLDEVSLDDSEWESLAGDTSLIFSQIALPDGTHNITSDSPFKVYSDTEYLTVFGDPSQFIEAPVSHYSKKMNFIVPSYVPRNFITIVVPVAALGTVVLDGEIINESRFVRIPQSDFAYAQFGVNPGSHTLSGGLPLAVNVYGFEKQGAYSFLGGRIARSSLSGVDLTVELEASFAMVGDEVCVNMRLNDQYLEALAYATFDVKVVGINEQRHRVVADEEALARFCYSGSYQGFDTIEISVNDISVSREIVWSVPASPVAPVFTSRPVIYGELDGSYFYQAAALDANNDNLVYELRSEISSLSVVSDTGLVTGQLPNFGEFNVELDAKDSEGLVATQKFLVRVNAVPKLVHPLLTSVNTGARVRNYMFWEDLDGADDIGAEVVSSDFPINLEFVTSGIKKRVLLDYTAPLVPGDYLVKFKIWDSEGASLNYDYVLTVVTPNAPPVITNDDVVVDVIAGDLATFQVAAIDPEGQPLQYGLTGSIPAGMVINSGSGVINWPTQLSDSGERQVTATVSDGAGGVTSKLVTFNVTENFAPVFISSPSLISKADRDYLYSVSAVDANSTPLTFSLKDGPENAVFDTEAASLQWVPAREGLQQFSIAVTDGVHEAVQSWVVDVAAAEFPMEAQLKLNSRFVDVADLVAVQFVTANAGGPLEYSLSFDGIPVVVDANGLSNIYPQTVGLHSLTGFVSDGVESVEVASSFYVKDPADIIAPIVQLHSPVDLQSVSEATDIYATITDVNLVEYEVNIHSVDGSYQKKLSVGDSALIEGLAAVLDPTQLINGLYQIIVSATDTGGNITTDGITVLVTGDLKVGNFSITQVDVDIPMSGVPVQVSRTYDNRQKYRNMAFGFGWSIDYQNLRLQESREPGDGWSLNQYATGPFGLIPLYCVEPNGSPLVTVTLPDGKLETFEVEASPQCMEGSPALDVDLVFTPQGDTQSTLVARDLASGRYNNGKVADYSSPTVAINPNKYRLTTRAGFIYDIDQVIGIEKITTPNGQTLTYSADGIIHSGGKSVVFGRDAKGRIETITDPAGNVTRYEYDSRGDLVSVKDPEQVAANADGSSYVYNNEHGLVDIFDPLGRRIVKNLYDDDGRLYAQEDSDGNITEFNHDLAGRTSTVTDRENRITVFGYDDNGNVLSEIRYAQGLVYSAPIQTDFAYDAQNNQTYQAVGGAAFGTSAEFNSNNDQLWAQDALGHRVTYDYNARGQENYIVDERGHRTDMLYDGAGNLTGIEGPAYTDPVTGLVKRDIASNVIGARGLVESTTDMRGNTTHYTYYPIGHAWADQKWTESTSLGGTVTYTYDENNNVKTESRERTVDEVVQTETVAYDYDARDRLTVTTYPDGSYTETEFDLAGNPYRTRDRFGVWTETEHDVYGRVKEIRYADGSKEFNTYNKEGELVTHTNQRGTVTRYEYDDFGRQWRVHNDTLGSFTETQYTPQGWVQYVWDENRNLTEYTYDAAGRRQSVIRHGDNGIKQTHSFDYYENGELLSETDALLHTTQYHINERDQRTQTQFHNGHLLKTEYDSMGTRVRAIDQNNRSTRYGYDDLGRLNAVQPEVQIDAQAVPVTSYSYDEVGNKLTQTDANSHTTRWTYDYFGRVISRTLPEGQRESFVYDDVTRQIIHTDFNGHDTVTQLDVMGRVESVHYYDGAFEQYTYYPDGLVHTATTAEGVTTYAYEARGLLETETRPDGTIMGYEYDAVGNRTLVSITRASLPAVTTRYTYDAFNRLETVTDATGVSRYTYDAVGNLDTLTYPNGLVTDYDYNSVNQLERVSTWDALGLLLGGYTYTLDNTGRRELITEDNGRITDYSYDALYRLTDEVIIDSVNGGYSANYQYDWVGNRTYEAVDGVQTAYVYDDNDRLTSQGGTSYSHDDNGNTLTETLDGLTTVYHYNGKNQLASVDKAGSSTSYRYNTNGIRIGKTEAGISIDFIVDENRDYAQVLQEIVDGNIAVSYSYGHDLIQQTRNAQTYFYHYDGLGSTRGLSDSAGNLTDGYNYEAFGEVLNQTGDTENSYLFTGEQFDWGLDQYYLRARYYDQGVGRFTQMDTYKGRMGEPITLHKYIYADANPANGVDPSGLMTLAGQMSVVSNISIRSVGTVGRVGSFGAAANSATFATTGALTNSQIGFMIISGGVSGSLLDLLNSKNKRDQREYVAKPAALIKGQIKVYPTKLDFVSAVVMAKSRGDLMAKTKEWAFKIALIASGGKHPGPAEIHGSGAGYRYHYHVKPRTPMGVPDAHIWY